MIWRFCILVFGVYCCSTAVIFIKRCAVHPASLSAIRLLGAAAILTPLLLRDLRRFGPAGRTERRRFAGWLFRRAAWPGVLLGAHFISWIVGARMTPAANSTLLVNMTPAIMPFFLYFLLRERLNAGEWAGTAIALAGMVVLSWTDLNLSTEFFSGDLVVFASMISAAGYLALARRNRDTSSIWLYITPLYWIAGLVSALATLAAGLLWEIPAGRTLLGELRLGDSAPLAIASWSDAAAVAALVLVPTIGGHTILNWSMKHFRGQTVSLTNLAQFVFATAMGMVWLRPPEFPDWLSFGPAAAMVLGGAVLALLTTPSDRSEVGIPESSSAAGDA